MNRKGTLSPARIFQDQLFISVDDSYNIVLRGIISLMKALCSSVNNYPKLQLCAMLIRLCEKGVGSAFLQHQYALKIFSRT